MCVLYGYVYGFNVPDFFAHQFSLLRTQNDRSRQADVGCGIEHSAEARQMWHSLLVFTDHIVTEYSVQSAEYNGQSTECRDQSTMGRVQSTRAYRVQSTAYSRTQSRTSENFCVLAAAETWELSTVYRLHRAPSSVLRVPGLFEKCAHGCLLSPVHCKVQLKRFRLFRVYFTLS